MITFLFVLLAVSIGVTLAALDDPGADDRTRAAVGSPLAMADSPARSA